MKATECRYDANGNTTCKIENGTQETVYTWNQEKRLVAVQTPAGENISYAYDADGVRVSKTVNGVTTEYLVDSNRDYAQVLEERVNDALIASYLYGLDLISQERGNADSYYLVDGLGSRRGLTDSAGNVTNTYSYDAFGNLVASAGGTANNYQFAGEQFDSNLDQYYLRQRYYNQNSGRFTRRDTYEGRLSDPITLHKYLYGNANPVTYTDPTGLFSAGEDQAAANIANTLAGIQWESGQRLIATTLLGGEEEEYLDEALFAIGAGVLTFVAVIGLPSIVRAFLLRDNDLVQRARDIHRGLPHSRRGRMTTAVARIRKSDGTYQIVVASSEKKLRPEQLPLLRPTELSIEGVGHAEQTIINWATSNSHQVQALAASRPMCIDCEIAVIRAGVRPAGRLQRFPQRRNTR